MRLKFIDALWVQFAVVRVDRTTHSAVTAGRPASDSSGEDVMNDHTRGGVYYVCREENTQYTSQYDPSPREEATTPWRTNRTD